MDFLLIKEDSMERLDVLREIADCINESDKSGAFGVGDRLLEVITFLKEEWSITDEDIPGRDATDTIN